MKEVTVFFLKKKSCNPCSSSFVVYIFKEHKSALTVVSENKFYIFFQLDVQSYEAVAILGIHFPGGDSRGEVKELGISREIGNHVQAIQFYNPT